jgi:hypothetical protein
MGRSFKGYANAYGEFKFMILQEFQPTTAPRGGWCVNTMHASISSCREIVRCKIIRPLCRTGVAMPAFSTALHSVPRGHQLKDQDRA